MHHLYVFSQWWVYETAFCFFSPYETFIKSESLSTIVLYSVGFKDAAYFSFWLTDCPSISLLCVSMYVLFIHWQITRNGRILSEKEYKLNIMKKDHQKYIRECLAQAIFHKVLDMEVQVLTISFTTDTFQ